MAKNKRELQAELEAANKRIAELSQSNQNANSNINNDEPPSWLKTFLEAQLSMQRQTQEQNVENQRQMQLESQRQLQQIIKKFSPQQLAQCANSERSESREQTIDVNNSIYFFYFYLYIYPPDSQESDGGAIHRVSNYPDLLPEMPRYCCPLVI